MNTRSLMIRGPEVLKNFDHTIRGKLMDVMDDTGIDIKPHTALSALSKQSDGAIKIDYMQHDGSGGDATGTRDTLALSPSIHASAIILG